MSISFYAVRQCPNCLPLAHPHCTTAAQHSTAMHCLSQWQQPKSQPKQQKKKNFRTHWHAGAASQSRRRSSVPALSLLWPTRCAQTRALFAMLHSPRSAPFSALLLTPYCVRPRSLCRTPLSLLLLTSCSSMHAPHSTLHGPHSSMRAAAHSIVRAALPRSVHPSRTVAVSPLIWYAPANYSH